MIKHVFTLIEIVCVILIIGIIMGVGIVNFVNIRFTPTPFDYAKKLKLMSVKARSIAIAQNEIQKIKWQKETNKLIYNDNIIDLSDNISLKLNNEVISSSKDILIFFPDGTGAEVYLDITENINDLVSKAVLRVSSLTGCVEIYEKE